MAKEVGEVAKRLATRIEQITYSQVAKRMGATFVDLHTALMGPNINLRAALRLLHRFHCTAAFICGDN